MKKQTDETTALPSLALVFGYIAIKELGLKEDRVAVLSRLGYGNKQIATICDIPPTSVAVLKHISKKRKGRRP